MSWLELIVLGFGQVFDIHMALWSAVCNTRGDFHFGTLPFPVLILVQETNSRNCRCGLVPWLGGCVCGCWSEDIACLPCQNLSGEGPSTDGSVGDDFFCFIQTGSEGKMHAIFCGLRLSMAKPLQKFGTAQRGVHFVARCMPGAYCCMAD